MTDLLFSICIPVYNVEKYLHKCIESVLNQSYDKYELILVDDGSTDNSYQICKDYQSKDRHIKAFTKENGGQISAREFAFDHASGDIILCVDSDDYIEKNALDVLNSYFVNENPDCIYFNWQRVSNDVAINSKKEIVVKETMNKLNEIIKRICTNSYYNSMCIKAFKKELLPKRKLFDFYKVRHGEDLIQTLGLIESAKTVLFIPDILYNYRTNVESISYKIDLGKDYLENSVRFYVYLFLKNKKFFSPKDWDYYGMYCVNLLYMKLYRISISNVSIMKKKECFRIIRNSQYYKVFLHGRKTYSFVKNVFISLFEKKIDYLVVFMFLLLKKTRK
ncbi:glycosyltransferase family 2 protein [Fibrobacter sp. UWB3]|uniref:glycosyltransferase family 2 protein n=1 Tax=Fibrobacter sp. UWB3 TaxID=1964357 RepID=UPI000B51EE22|nr:glycosyltransferase family 2 protein [Fibrobacter sp. UWB3]OWV21879.1 hypothetical protein B7991_02655 [Fibrobacter sp. UWB3]